MATLLGKGHFVQISGSITALATPFTSSCVLDIPAWHKHLAHQLDAGTQGLVVAGSTGEAAMLSSAELDELVRTAIEVAAGRVPIIVGAGLSGTDKTIEQCRRAQAAGATALLVATPSYVRPTQEGLRRHFEAVADTLEIPVLLYNVPTRTGIDLLPETVAALASHPNIIGIKEALPDPDRWTALLALRSQTFGVLSGDDHTACRAMLSGADGVVSVASNVAPAAFRRLCELARTGHASVAQELNAALLSIMSGMGLESNPIPVKAVLSALGMCENVLRLPLLPLSSHLTPTVATIVEHVREVEARCLPDHAT